MEIVLLERVENLGQMGDVVRVKDGFARNFLLPRGKALRANKANLERFEQERAQLEARNLEQRSEAEQVGEKLNGEAVILIRQASETGQLYGSVTAKDIAEALSAAGFSVEKSQVRLDKPIKTLGLAEVRVMLHPEVSVSVTANTARSEEEAERQAAGENVLGEKEEELEDLINAEDVFDPEALEAQAEEAAAEEAAESEAAEAEDAADASEEAGDEAEEEKAEG